ncbi:hypothetical protein, partial [Thermomonospora echinospora]
MALLRGRPQWQYVRYMAKAGTFLGGRRRPAHSPALSWNDFLKGNTVMRKLVRNALVAGAATTAAV